MRTLSGAAYHAMLELPVTDAYAGTAGKVAELVSAATDTLVGFWGAFLGLCMQVTSGVKLGMDNMRNGW